MASRRRAAPRSWRWLLCALLSSPLPAGGCGGDATGPSVGTCACPKAVKHTVAFELDCLCGGTAQGCPETIVDYASAPLCANGTAVIQTTGCGKVRLGPIGTSGSSVTFDLASGALVGAYQWSNIASGACSSAGAFSYIYGEPLFANGEGITTGLCTKVQRCTLCGEASDGTRRCSM